MGCDTPQRWTGERECDLLFRLFKCQSTANGLPQSISNRIIFESIYIRLDINCPDSKVLKAEMLLRRRHAAPHISFYPPPQCLQFLLRPKFSHAITEEKADYILLLHSEEGRKLGHRGGSGLALPVQKCQSCDKRANGFR